MSDSASEIIKKADVQTSSKIITKPAPFNWSEFEMTGNKAIDLAAQYIGHGKKTGRSPVALLLKPAYFDLFKKGLDVLNNYKKDENGQAIVDQEDLANPVSVILFDGVKIKRGGRDQWENIIAEYSFVKLAENG